MPFEVPESWEWAIISDISTSIQYGYTGKAISEGKYKMLRITDIQNNSVDWASVPFVEIEDNKAKDYLLFDSNILFARTGATVGKSFLIENLDEKSVFASYLIRINTSNNINARYLNHFLDSDFYWKQIMERSIGTGQPNVNGTILGELKIPIPPYVEQQRIVNEIQNQYKWISIIDESKQVLDELIQHSKSKILDLAIRGKLVPQDPNDEPASILLEQIRKEQKLPKKTADKFPYPFEIPNGWKWCKFSDLYLLISGRDLEKDEFNDTESGIPYLIGASSFNNNQFEINRWTNTPKVVSGKGDLLITCKGTVGDLIVNDIGDVHIARQFMAIRSTGITELKFTEYFFQYSISAIKESAKGVIPGIARKDILDIIIPLPPLSEQKRIISQIEKIFALLDMIGESLKA